LQRDPRWAFHFQAGQLVKDIEDCEREIELDTKLTRVLKGEIQPADAGERLMLAQICQLPGKALYASAARFYADAFGEQPKLEANPQGQHRYNAACAAVLAGCGQGKDGETLNDTERAALRRKARDWLQADLDVYARQVKDGKAESVLSEVRLARLQTDSDFVGVRDAQALAKLPEAEQAEWSKLWADVEQLLMQVHSLITERTLNGTLTDRQHEHVHDIKLEASKTYVIDMKSKKLDSYLKLYDPAGKLVAENDDIAPNNLDSRIVFTPKEAGVYRIIATSFEQRGRGAYTLTIRAVGK
jgi:hypothetical protein